MSRVLAGYTTSTRPTIVTITDDVRVYKFTGGGKQAETAPGFDLIAAIVDTHLMRRSRLDRLQDAVARHPGLPGLGVDEDTALVIEEIPYTARI